MTRSNPRQRAPQPAHQAEQAALSAAFGRAVDLSALKRPAEPARPAATPNGSAGAPGSSASAPTSSPHVIDVTEATFREVVEASMNVLVIVDLWAEWCQPCKQLSPALERVVNSYNGTVLLAKVDVDANPRISQAFGVQSIPTVVAIAGGQPVDAFAGAQPEPEVRRWIQRLVDAVKGQLPGMSATGSEEDAPPPDPLFVKAENALDEGDFDTAIAAYEQYLVNNPGDADVKLAVAQLKFQQRAAGLPPDAVRRAQAAPTDIGLQLDAATLLFATGEVEPAFEWLVDAFAQAAGDDAAREQLRAHLLDLFDLLGHDDPRVVKWRRRFAAALY